MDTFLYIGSGVIVLVSYYKSSRRLIDFLDRNPGVYTGVSTEAVSLIRQCIEVTNEMLKLLPHLTEQLEEHKYWLMELLNDFPDKDPEENPDEFEERLAA